MNTAGSFGALALLLLLFGLPADPPATPDPLPPTMRMVGSYGQPTSDGGCRHTIKVRNDGSRTVYMEWTNSHVRNRVGWWKQIYGGGFGVFYRPPNPSTFPVGAGKSHSWIYTTDFGCNAKRRWRFNLRRSDGKEHMLYYPSSSSFSTNTTVDLGNLGRRSLW